MISISQLACLLVRLLGTGMILFNLGHLIANIIVSWDQFNPTYWWFFVETQLVLPFIFFILGCLVYLSSGWLGRRLAKGL